MSTTKIKRISPETSRCLAVLRSSSEESPVSAMDGMPWVIFPQKRKKLLCPPVNAQCGKVSFFGGRLDGAHDLVCQLDLCFDAAAVVLYVVKALRTALALT